MNLKPTLAEIKAAHAPRREYERWLGVNRLLFRPLSFPGVWLLARLGVSSEAASWFSGAAALAAFACLLRPEGPLFWPGVELLFLFNYADCLDGGLARALGTRNPYGRFLDSIMVWADMAFWAVLGTAVWRLPELRFYDCECGPDPLAWAAAGVLCSFFVAYSASLEGIFDLTLRPYWEKLAAAGGEPPASSPLEGKKGAAFWGRVLAANLRVRETHYLLLALAGLARAVDLLLAFFLVFYALLTLALLIAYCRRGRRVFDSGAGREAR